MSDANRTRVGIVEEGSFGVPPNNPEFQTLRIVSSSLSFAPKTVSSAEIRADRQVSDLILVGAEASGEIGMEVSFKAQDTVIEGGFFNSYVKTPEIVNSAADTEITAVDDTTDTFTVAAGGAAFVTGMLVKSSGFGQSANNQVFQVASSTGTTVVAGDAVTTAAETAPPKGARLKAVGYRGVSGDIVAAVTPNRLTSTALDFTTLGIVAGQWLKIGGGLAANRFATSAVNGFVRVKSVSANSLELEIVPTGWVADAGAGKTISFFFGDYIRNGTEEHSYSLEQAFLSNDQYQYLYGMMVNSLSFQADAQALMKTQVSFMGKNGEYVSSAIAGATNAPATTDDVLNTSANVGRIAENGAVVTGPNYVMSANIKIENKLRQQNAIGSIGAVGIGVGQCSVSGQLNTYFGNSDLLNKVINNTATSFDLRVADNAGQTMLFDLPKVKFSAGTTPVTGIDTDIMADLPFQAIAHETYGYTIGLYKFEVTA